MGQVNSDFASETLNCRRNVESLSLEIASANFYPPDPSSCAMRHFYPALVFFAELPGQLPSLGRSRHKACTCTGTRIHARARARERARVRKSAAERARSTSVRTVAGACAARVALEQGQTRGTSSFESAKNDERQFFRRSFLASIRVHGNLKGFFCSSFGGVWVFIAFFWGVWKCGICFNLKIDLCGFIGFCWG